ncbi:MAG: DUF624 domain-containing protein [Oscillospiraceae bacterium]|nr:DUF624 domain-containing protein [Oscillospiraceae bacterium]
MPLFGFFDYTSSGKGIAKNEPVKRPFFKFMELFSRKFWKLIYVNILYFLFCLPVVTIGPATAAMTQVMRKFTLEQPIFVFDEFFTAFKKNFKQGLAVGLFDIFFVVCFVVAYASYDIRAQFEPTLFNIALLSLTIASGIFIWMMHFYIYVQIAALSLNIRQIVKNSFLFVILGLKGNLVTLIFSALLFIGMFIFIPFSFFLMPFIPFAWVCFLTVFNSYPVIQKYIITPYYESKGEKNPEIPDYASDDEDKEEALFEDFGGREAEIKSKPKPKGKVIR